MQALVVDAVPLLGMSLLRGSELRVEAKPGGESRNFRQKHPETTKI